MAMTAKKQRAIVALLTERTTADAAGAAGVGLRTLHRWLAEDGEFQAALRQAEEGAIDHAVRRLVGLQDTAIAVLAAVLDTDDISAGVRVRAAGMVLENVLRLRELRTLEERIAALEAAYNTQAGRL